MKRLYCNVFMFDQPMIIFLCFYGYFYHVVICLASLLLDMCIYSKSLSSTAWVRTFITSILEFRLLGLIYSTRVISTIGKFTSYELRLALLTFEIH
jgi:hypothetical protein